jgi:hypothetical protein
MMWGVATLHIKRYREYQLSSVNYSRESIKNHEYVSSNLKPNSNSLQKPSKELGRKPFVKKIRGKKSHRTFPFITDLYLLWLLVSIFFGYWLFFFGYWPMLLVVIHPLPFLVIDLHLSWLRSMPSLAIGLCLAQLLISVFLGFTDICIPWIDWPPPPLYLPWLRASAFFP